jgi:hypothetical protein
VKRLERLQIASSTSLSQRYSDGLSESGLLLASSCDDCEQIVYRISSTHFSLAQSVINGIAERENEFLVSSFNSTEVTRELIELAATYRLS